MPTEKIMKLILSNNIADDLTHEELTEISRKVMAGLREDERSMEDWLDFADRAMELTKLEREEKNIPFRNASNIKYPLITTAVIQFASRTLPELIKNGEVARYKVIGKDPDGIKNRKGIRVKTHLNWQILEKMPHWMDERDRLHHQLAVVGTSYTKTWFDPVISLNRSELIPYDQIVVNNSIKNLEEAPRISQYIYMTKNEMVEKMRWDLFREIDLDNLEMDLIDPEAVYHELIEQHCWLDLDEDGYDEPYIVTVHRASTEVMRIVARYSETDVLYNKKGKVKKIFPQHFFTDYHFIPNADGSFHSLGFGTLLLDMNATVNTVLNQLINAGHLATVQGGFIGRDLRIRKEDLEIDPGEWIIAEGANGASIKDNVVPFNYKEPSTVLFQLLGVMIESAQTLTSTTDALTGTADTSNTSPNTLMALIQQGLKVYSAIQRRIMRGFKKELQRLVILNSKHLNVEEYLALIDPSNQEVMEMFNQQGELLDYQLASVDIVPVVDSNSSTEAEALVRSQAEMQAGLQLVGVGAVNPRELARNYFTALETPNIDKLIAPEPDPNAPNPDMIRLQSDLDMRGRSLEMQEKELRLKELETTTKAKETIAKGIKAIADAEATEAGAQLSIYKQAFDQLAQELDLTLREKELENVAQTREETPSA